MTAPPATSVAAACNAAANRRLELLNNGVPCIRAQRGHGASVRTGGGKRLVHERRSGQRRNLGKLPAMDAPVDRGKQNRVHHLGYFPGRAEHADAVVAAQFLGITRQAFDAQGEIRRPAGEGHLDPRTRNRMRAARVIEGRGKGLDVRCIKADQAELEGLHDGLPLAGI